ncbi:substrate-binding periplasmic protein [Wenyingzhuangia sp. IMCC45574]
MKKTLTIILTLTLVIGISYSFKSKTDSKKVRIFVSWPGTESLPHYEWKSNLWKPTGIEPKFVEEIMKTAGLEFEYIYDYKYNNNGDPRIDILTEGKADISIRGITITKDRKEKVLFSTSYYTDGLGIMTTKNSKIESVNDLVNKKVYAHDYTTAYTWISKNLPKSRLITHKEGQNYIEPEQLLREGKIDAYIIDYSYLNHLARINKDFKVLNEKLTSEKLGIAVSKKRKDLLKKINKAITILKKEGALEKLRNRFEN